MSTFQSNKKFLIILFSLIVTFTASTSFAKTNKASGKNCDYRSFSIKISQSVSISELINEIGSMCNFSIITKDVQAKKLLDTTLNGININNMSLFEIFDLVLAEHNLNYNYQKNMLKLSSLTTKTFKIDYITSVREGTASLSASVEIETVGEGESRGQSKASDNEIKVKEKFDFWDTLDAEIKSILNNGTDDFQAPDPIINKNTGLITITGTKSQLDRVGSYIENLRNRLHKQVMIDVSIISVKLSNQYTRGIDWSKFQLSLKSEASTNTASSSSTNIGDALNNTVKNLSIINNANFSMEGLLGFIKQKGDTKILSSPKVMTLNNQQSLITIGDNINYRVLQETEKDKDTGETKITYTPYSVFIGVLLNLLPEVSDDDKIMLRINPSLSSFKYPEDDKKQIAIREIAPDTLEKKLSTVVQVNSGDTIILGGLIGQTKGKNKTSVPLLGDLPILGMAFKSTEDTIVTNELVFVITPYVMNSKDSKNIGTSLRKLGYSESLYE